MGILTEATIEQSAVKMGLFGFQGSSKSYTAFLIALALSKVHHNGAPIALHDTEDASDWLVPIAKMEGVRILRKKSVAFVDMVAVLREGEQAGACAFIQDQVSRPWKEVQASYMKKKNVKRLDFQHWAELKNAWQQQFVDRYLASPLHCFVVGRAGYEYDTVEDENGKRQQERVGTRMKAETEFGYEPHLLVEMEGRRVIPPDEEGDGTKKKRRVRKQGGLFEYYAHVLKDRSRALNALSIRLPDLSRYKAGDYQKVYDIFAPHWALMNFGQRHVGIDVDKSSGDMFDAPNGDPTNRRWHRAKVALEEIEGMLTAIWPGTAEAAKKGKREAVRTLFGTYSWTAVETRPLESLETAVDILRTFTAELKRTPGDVDHGIALLAMCVDRAKEEVLAPATPQIGVIAPEGTLPL